MVMRREEEEGRLGLEERHQMAHRPAPQMLAFTLMSTCTEAHMCLNIA